jgi:hypothetical protein
MEHQNKRHEGRKVLNPKLIRTFQTLIEFQEKGRGERKDLSPKDMEKGRTLIQGHGERKDLNASTWRKEGP